MSQFLFPCSCVGGLVSLYMPLVLKSCHYCHMGKTRMIFALYSRDGPKNVTWLCCKKDEVTPLRVMLARTDHCLLNS